MSWWCLKCQSSAAEAGDGCRVCGGVLVEKKENAPFTSWRCTRCSVDIDNGFPCLLCGGVQPAKSKSKTKIEEAIVLLEDALILLLSSTEKQRFVKATRLINIVRALQKETGERVGDFRDRGGVLNALHPAHLPIGGQIGYDDDGNLNDEVMPYRNPNDQGELLREAFMSQQKANTANNSSAAARELESLIASKQMLNAKKDKDLYDTIAARIEKVTAKIKELSNEHVTNSSASVVPADDVRGHPARVAGREHNEDDLREDDADRGQRGQRVAYIRNR